MSAVCGKSVNLQPLNDCRKPYGASPKHREHTQASGPATMKTHTMSRIINLTLSPKQAADAKYYTSQAARELHVREQNIALLRIVKRSVDARRGALKVNLSLEAFIDDEPQPAPLRFDYPSVDGKREAVIIGAGPAGLFAALRLIESGVKPIIFERGKEVVERGKDIARIQRNQGIDPDSNYAFGEGGAGTFSDGKLFTRSKKRGDYNRALQRLVFHGASPEILYEAHPHIGSDRLPRIIADIRRQIIASGGEIHFGKRVTAIKIRNGRVAGIEADGTNVDTDTVIVATGHSARDIYEMLDDGGIRLEAKPFAMGVRIEHPQSLIDRIQYHSSEQMEYLPAASYSLVAQIGGRGVYSFCMCPGGFIVPGDDRRVGIGRERNVAEPAQLAVRQFGFRNGDTAVRFRASATEIRRTRRIAVPARTRTRSPRERRRKPDRTGTARFGFRRGTRFVVAAQIVIRPGVGMLAARRMDAAIHVVAPARSNPRIRQAYARLSDERSDSSRRRIAHLDACTHSPRCPNADAPRCRRAFPVGRGCRIRRRHNLGSTGRRTNRRSGNRVLQEKIGSKGITTVPKDLNDFKVFKDFKDFTGKNSVAFTC